MQVDFYHQELSDSILKQVVDEGLGLAFSSRRQTVIPRERKEVFYEAVDGSLASPSVPPWHCLGGGATIRGGQLGRLAHYRPGRGHWTLGWSVLLFASWPHVVSDLLH